MSDNFSPKNLEIKMPETVIGWGNACVFAPHPDDESLGCGGAIALLRNFELPVNIIVMSDGTLSHPNSRKFPPAALRAKPMGTKPATVTSVPVSMGKAVEV